MGRQRGWTRRDLERRGWTAELIQELLPPPTEDTRGAGRAYWRWDDIKPAEQTEAFQKERVQRQPKEQPKPAQQEQPPKAQAPQKPPRIQPTEDVKACLREAWRRLPKTDTAAWKLASFYHRAVLDHVQTEDNRRWKSMANWVGEFLAMERSPQPEEAPRRLTSLARSGYWLSRNLRAPLTARLYEHYAAVLLTTAEAVLQHFSKDRPDTDPMAALTAKGFPIHMLLQENLQTIWAVWYVPQAIRTSLSALLALDPKDEYPEARAMRRRFVLHVGGTNTGKTYECFQRLIRAQTGVYLGPLRLLALEAQEYLLDAGVACGLATGEEEDLREGDTHVASTAEKLELHTRYDVAVIDECQMIQDRQRGYAWTRAILGVLAPEVHLCAAPEAEKLLVSLVESCGDKIEVVHHERKVPLICMNHNVDFHRVQPGDALITFSKVGVLSVAEDLRQSGKEPAIIYGALPYGARRRQMEGFLKGDMQYVVSTDAIGMGLNLPIRRVIFMETEKFDGVETRELKPEEIRQIAGRAGRYGMYSKGFVGATHNIHKIQYGLDAVVPPLEHAVLGFSDLVLQADFDLLQVLEEWSRMPTVKPFVKMDVSRYISIISMIRREGFDLDRATELRAANIPFDETDPELRELFFRYVECWQNGIEPEQPGVPEDNPTLPELEQYCRKLDLYYSASRAFDFNADLDHIQDCRERAADMIHEILVYRLRSNIRFCADCKKPLPLHYPYRLCQDCYRKHQRARWDAKDW